MKRPVAGLAAALAMTHVEAHDLTVGIVDRNLAVSSAQRGAVAVIDPETNDALSVVLMPPGPITGDRIRAAVTLSQATLCNSAMRYDPAIRDDRVDTVLMKQFSAHGRASPLPPGASEDFERARRTLEAIRKGGAVDREELGRLVTRVFDDCPGITLPARLTDLPRRDYNDAGLSPE